MGLVKDTAIYGLSSIIGRFLNWLLVPLYTVVFAKAEYGIVTYMYAVIAVVLVVLTYGMETGFFRFANHERWKDPMEVYTTALTSLATTSTLFIALVLLMLQPLTEWMHCEGHESYVWMMTVCVAVDAFTALPFGYLRYKKRPMRFATLRLINIGLNIGLNLFFILLCPWLKSVSPQTVDWFYVADYGIGYIFLSNLISSLVTLVMLVPELRAGRWRFCWRLWREMLAYSAPLLVLGIAGIMNQTFDKMFFPTLYHKPDVMAQLGVYGANYKIAIIMVMFTQAFRFAYEPYIFAQNKERGRESKRAYSDAMKGFIVVSLLIFMGVMFYLDIIKYFISKAYFGGLAIVPIVMMGEVFFGVFYNLSVWYKLSDRTHWGMWFSLLGVAVTVAVNVIFVPEYGYMACAWAAFFCYLVMMVTSYFVGQHYYPIAYPLRRIGVYVLLTAVLYGIGLYLLVTPYALVNYLIRALLIAAFVVIVMRVEKISLKNLMPKIR